MSSTHVHTDMDVHYQTASKVMCTHALCVAFFFFPEMQKDFLGKMWQIHATCGKDHTEKLFEKSAWAAARGQ